MERARYLVDAVVVGGESPTRLARSHGISRSWLFELLQRFREGGYPALEPHSRRPRSNPQQTSAEVVAEVARFRVQHVPVARLSIESYRYGVAGPTRHMQNGSAPAKDSQVQRASVRAEVGGLHHQAVSVGLGLIVEVSAARDQRKPGRPIGLEESSRVGADRPAPDGVNDECAPAPVGQHHDDLGANPEAGQPTENQRLVWVPGVAVDDRVSGIAGRRAGLVPGDVEVVVGDGHRPVAIDSDRLNARMNVDRRDQQLHGWRGRHKDRDDLPGGRHPPASEFVDEYSRRCPDDVRGSSGRFAWRPRRPIDGKPGQQETCQQDLGEELPG